MLVFRITNNVSNIELNRQQAIDLELKLNVSSRGHELKYIGDLLYDFGCGRDTPNTLIVLNDVMNFLEMLMTKTSWHDCHGL